MHDIAAKTLKRDLVLVFLAVLILVALGGFLRPYYAPGPIGQGPVGVDLSTKILKSGVRFAFGVTYFKDRKYIPFPWIYGIGMLLLILGGSRFLSAARGIRETNQQPQGQTTATTTTRGALAGLLVALVSLLLVANAGGGLAPYGLSFIAVWPAILLSCRNLSKSTGSDYASRTKWVVAIAAILALLPLVSFGFQFAYPSGIYLGWKALCPWLLLGFIAVLGAVVIDSILESEMRPPQTSAFAMSLVGYAVSMTAWFAFRLGTGQ